MVSSNGRCLCFYKRENAATVAKLVTALRAHGLDVWWDMDIPPSAPWEAILGPMTVLPGRPNKRTLKDAEAAPEPMFESDSLPLCSPA